jgi:DNA modification methylase
MPSLQWASKSNPQPVPAALNLDSIIYPRGDGYPDALPHSHLILGDNLAVLSALLPEYEGRINLIYADPPFYTNKHYPARVGRGEDSRRPQEWKLAEGYPDHWEDIDSYLDMLYPRLALMHRLLAPTGSFYLHLDWHANAYARLLLDEIFGAERLLNEIVWVYHGPSPVRRSFNRKHDTLLVYTKSQDYTFNVDAVRQPYNPSTVKTFAASPKAGFGKVPDLERGKVPEDWWYFPVVARLHNERTGYPTQKPEALLERIVLASSNPGDLVADFFCGSGTAAVAASRHGRRFIANDLSWRAAHITRRRLASEMEEPFDLLRVAMPGGRQDGPIDEAPNLQPSTQFNLQLVGDRLVLDTEVELDYWEVDPVWDGNVFRSAAQGVRPLRKGNLPKELALPVQPGGEGICVRLVGVRGEVCQILL